VSALKEKAMHKIVELEKKMLRAEKRKFQAHQNQIQSIRNHLFPGDGLQERKENLSYFYALWGHDFLKHYTITHWHWSKSLLCCARYNIDAWQWCVALVRVLHWCVSPRTNNIFFIIFIYYE
jgi:hypothetical protein